MMHSQLAWFQECCEHHDDADTASEVVPQGQVAHPPGLGAIMSRRMDIGQHEILVIYDDEC